MQKLMGWLQAGKEDKGLETFMEGKKYSKAADKSGWGRSIRWMGVSHECCVIDTVRQDNLSKGPGSILENPTACNIWVVHCTMCCTGSPQFITIHLMIV